MQQIPVVNNIIPLLVGLATLTYIYTSSNFYRAMLCQRGISCRRVSVCLSVCLSVRPSVRHKPVLYRNGYRQDHANNAARQPRDSSFLVPKIFSKFERGHPQRGRQMEVGQGKVGAFRQRTRCMSKTVQDRRIVSIKVELGSLCALSNGDIADDLG